MIVKINSPEEMCDLMCDNRLPESECWVFTFGYGQEHAGKYVKIRGTYDEAREKMVEKYGIKWAFQYSKEEWEDWEARRPEYITETLLEEL